MIERAHRFGNLVFDRDAIVRAALRAYIEGILAGSPLRLAALGVSVYPRWIGDLQRGAFENPDGEGNHDVVAWTETGVVGLAYELGFGPLEQLDLSKDAITGGPDDVRGALPGLPDELEPALLLAARMLGRGNDGELNAGVGFWLYGDCVGGSMFFDDPTPCSAHRLAAWGLLRGDRLPRVDGFRVVPAKPDPPYAVPLHAIIDAVTARALVGPTELLPEELAMLLPTPPNPNELLVAQHRLLKVGIRWPGSPELPPLPPPGLNPFTRKPFTAEEIARGIL